MTTPTPADERLFDALVDLLSTLGIALPNFKADTPADLNRAIIQWIKTDPRISADMLERAAASTLDRLRHRN